MMIMRGRAFMLECNQHIENVDGEDYIDKAKIQYSHNCDNCMKSSIDEHFTSSDPSSQSGCVSQSHDLDAVVYWSRK